MRPARALFGFLIGMGVALPAAYVAAKASAYYHPSRELLENYWPSHGSFHDIAAICLVLYGALIYAFLFRRHKVGWIAPFLFAFCYPATAFALLVSSDLLWKEHMMSGRDFIVFLPALILTSALIWFGRAPRVSLQ